MRMERMSCLCGEAQGILPPQRQCKACRTVFSKTSMYSAAEICMYKCMSGCKIHFWKVVKPATYRHMVYACVYMPMLLPVRLSLCLSVSFSSIAVLCQGSDATTTTIANKALICVSFEVPLKVLVAMLGQLVD